MSDGWFSRLLGFFDPAPWANPNPFFPTTCYHCDRTLDLTGESESVEFDCRYRPVIGKCGQCMERKAS